MALDQPITAAMIELIVIRDWLTVCQLPPYAHELNPSEHWAQTCHYQRHAAQGR